MERMHRNHSGNQPDMTARSIFGIDFEQLKEMGIRGILTDVDNTVAKQFGRTRPEMRDLFARLKKDFDVAIVSNNRSEHHIRKISEELGIPYVYKARKSHSTKGFLKGLEIIGTKPEETAMIGDQVISDVRGGKAAGLFVIQVNPMSLAEFVPPRELIYRIRYAFKAKSF